MTAFHVKYRPTELSEVVGNKVVIDSINGLFEREELPRVWLLSGNSGVGKTTIARIIAHKVGAKGAGLIEMNAADFRGIDAMRDLVGKMNYKVFGSDKVVAILDECHQLTTEAQNLLLKSLEDTPKFACFILATTDTDKILDTIRTRCLEFNLQLLPDEEIKSLLISIAKKEDLSDIAIKGIDLVVKHAGGSPRLALNMLERISRVDASLEQMEKMLEKTSLTFQQEGEIAVSSKIMSSLLKKDRKSEWSNIAKELRQYLFTRKGDPEFLRKGICSKLSFKVLDGDLEAADMLMKLLDSRHTKAGLIGDLFSCCFNTTSSKSSRISERKQETRQENKQERKVLWG